MTKYNELQDDQPLTGDFLANPPSYSYAIEQSEPTASPSAPPGTPVATSAPTRTITNITINAHHQPNRGFWHQSFCCDSCDLAECCMACVCPSLYACFLAKDMGESSCTALCNCLCFPFCLCCLRTKARGKHSIPGGICCDAWLTLCFPCCAMMQMRNQYRTHHI